MYVKKVALSSAVLVLCASGHVLAGDGQQGNQAEAAKFNHNAVGLVRTVLDWASRYKNIDTAIGDGYLPASGCVSGPNGGAMGIHYARFDLVGDGALDATTPELLVYEPNRWGKMRLVAVEYLVIKEAWEAKNGVGTPAILDGQHMMLTGAPNQYGLPAHYMLHVWAFKNNKSGVFAPYNPAVTCKNFQPATG
ncbi:MAG TPA: hypothetical protein PKK10_02920 [Woeseiaceae bacterium]|nr:hypothetical protein [Woeseiaceae bacterium]